MDRTEEGEVLASRERGEGSKAMHEIDGNRQEGRGASDKENENPGRRPGKERARDERSNLDDLMDKLMGMPEDELSLFFKAIGKRLPSTMMEANLLGEGDLGGAPPGGASPKELTGKKARPVTLTGGWRQIGSAARRRALLLLWSAPACSMGIASRRRIREKVCDWFWV